MSNNYSIISPPLSSTLGEYKTSYLNSISSTHTPPEISGINEVLSLLPLDSNIIEDVLDTYRNIEDPEDQRVLNKFYTYIRNN